MKSQEQIRIEMKNAMDDFQDLMSAAFYGIKGKNPIYNQAIDNIYGGKSPWRKDDSPK